jgi:hypothetical protein
MKGASFSSVHLLLARNLLLVALPFVVHTLSAIRAP